MRKKLVGEGTGARGRRPVRPVLAAVAFLAAVVGSNGSRSLEAQAQQPATVGGRERPVWSGELTAASDIRYTADGYEYLFDVWLRSRVGLLFDMERVKAAINLEYLNGPETGEDFLRDGLGLWESYLRGGTEYSNIQIGVYVEDWGASLSRGLSSVLNERDDRYPDNVFFSKYYRPNPLFSMTAGKESFYTQAVLSNRELPVESIEDSDFGFRSVVKSGAVRTTGGMIKNLGSSSLLSFATLEQERAGGRQWLEVDWRYIPSGEDVWSVALGFSRGVSSSKIAAEYLLLGREDILFLGEELKVSETVGFDLKCYIHFPDFSTAFSGFFSLGVGEGFTLEPGVYGFIGKHGAYFSPTVPENDNRAVVRMRFQFG